MSKTKEEAVKQKILVLGSRKGLIDTLKSSEKAFVVWSPNPNKESKPDRLYRNYPQSSKEWEELKTDLPDILENITHVVASGEGTVGLANLARKCLGLKIIEEKVIRLCSDKLLMKEAARKAGIKVTKFLPGDHQKTSSEIYQELGERVVVKERNNSGGKGQKIYQSPTPISSQTSDLIEGFLVGSEMSVESFIKDGEIIFTSTTKYHELAVINIVPSLIDETTLSEVMDLNKRVIKEFDIKNGLTHLEVYLTTEGVIFGEVALRPPGGHIMQLIELTYGFNPWDIYLKLHLNEEINLHPKTNKHAAAIIYHPGEGRIEKVEGMEEVSKLESMKKIKLLTEVGDIIAKRNGVGQECAHLILSNQDRERLESDLKVARSTFSMVLS